MQCLRVDAERICSAAIAACMPQQAVLRALRQMPQVRGRILLVAIGKAAWTMAQAAVAALGDRIDEGIVITKYGHSCGELPHMRIFEAGHPVPDESTLRATQAALEMTARLQAEDLVLFLVSGGGSALFESMDCTLADLQGINQALLASGASIEEINTVRKHLSNVKGGRFALHCAPAHVFSILLSDVLGDRLDTIASGPSVPDGTTAREALHIADVYHLNLSREVRALLERETPKTLSNVTHEVGGSVRELCAYAVQEAEHRGYRTVLLTDQLCCEAREAGKQLAAIALAHRDTDVPLAFVAGGETVVRLRGNGLGGRNQELALAAAINLAGVENVAVISVGSDGTDGPTDAAGGYADGNTCARLQKAGIDPQYTLDNNDSYHALMAVEGLIVTGPTGTNVNDVAVVLIAPKQ